VCGAYPRCVGGAGASLVGVQKRLFPLLIQLAVEEPLSKQLLVAVESKVTEKVMRTHHRRTRLENQKTSF
jgi:hypothetical protein